MMHVVVVSVFFLNIDCFRCSVTNVFSRQLRPTSCTFRRPKPTSGLSTRPVTSNECGREALAHAPPPPPADTKPGSDEIKLYLGGSGHLWTTTDGQNFVRYDKVPTLLVPHPLLDDVALATFASNPCEIQITTDFVRRFSLAVVGCVPF